MLTCKELASNKTGDQWVIGKPEDACPDGLCAFYKTNGLGRNSDEIISKDM